MEKIHTELYAFAHKKDYNFSFTFFVMAFGSVPNCGASAGRSTGLFISDGTDSVLRILATAGENNHVTTCTNAKQVQPINCTERMKGKTHLAERRFCRMEPPLCICCGTLICIKSRQHTRVLAVIRN